MVSSIYEMNKVILDDKTLKKSKICFKCTKSIHLFYFIYFFFFYKFVIFQQLKTKLKLQKDIKYASKINF